MITIELIELIARTICSGCDENPDGSGNLGPMGDGNRKRWMDYVDIAEDVIKAIDSHRKDNGV